jgi:hypothetical protein
MLPESRLRVLMPKALRAPTVIRVSMPKVARLRPCQARRKKGIPP